MLVLVRNRVICNCKYSALVRLTKVEFQERLKGGEEARFAGMEKRAV